MTTYIRPGFLMTHVANPIASRLGRVPALIVRGRRSGRTLTVPMGEPLEFEGRRYLVSGRGETHWVRNLRAAGRGDFRIHGTPTSFRATEITGTDHDRVVDAYRRKLGHSVDPYFGEIPDPAGHPVFRMDPVPIRPPRNRPGRSADPGAPYADRASQRLMRALTNWR
jgi:hypothetical protein